MLFLHLIYFTFLSNHNGFSLFLLDIILILCLKIGTFSDLPIFHSKQRVMILLFNLLIATIYSRGKNKKKNCWNNSLIKSTAYLFLFRQKWFLKGVLIHWMGLISPETGEVLRLGKSSFTSDLVLGES